MTPAEFYSNRAVEFIERGERIPIDLFYELLAVGVDVDALERKHQPKEAA